MRTCDDCGREFAHGGALAAHRRASHQPVPPTTREAWRAMLAADQEAFRLAVQWEQKHRIVDGVPYVPGRVLDEKYDAAVESSHAAHVEWEAALERVASRENTAA